ncbi:hypothetical protein SKAU_G00391640 [Synaphobranchus kaupii]|uniref:Uncharacterized protein n=1 Tax=Synaphobranchus kaupii TaxID=118154 RepID=A0A9Q1IDN0_SYNKA|nr:hypothetical protein SKAU_G00391640 [Synaphobranchus kaupii]
MKNNLGDDESRILAKSEPSSRSIFMTAPVPLHRERGRRQRFGPPRIDRSVAANAGLRSVTVVRSPRPLCDIMSRCPYAVRLCAPSVIREYNSPVAAVSYWTGGCLESSLWERSAPLKAADDEQIRGAGRPEFNLSRKAARPLRRSGV